MSRLRPSSSTQNSRSASSAAGPSPGTSSRTSPIALARESYVHDYFQLGGLPSPPPPWPTLNGQYKCLARAQPSPAPGIPLSCASCVASARPDQTLSIDRTAMIAPAGALLLGLCLLDLCGTSIPSLRTGFHFFFSGTGFISDFSF